MDIDSIQRFADITGGSFAEETNVSILAVKKLVNDNSLNIQKLTNCIPDTPCWAFSCRLSALENVGIHTAEDFDNLIQGDIYKLQTVKGIGIKTIESLIASLVYIMMDVRSGRLDEFSAWQVGAKPWVRARWEVELPALEPMLLELNDREAKIIKLMHVPGQSFDKVRKEMGMSVRRCASFYATSVGKLLAVMTRFTATF